MKHATHADLAALERSIAQALAVLAGLMAHAVGSGPLALHFAAALNAVGQQQPNPQRDALLRDAYRLVLIRAANEHPGDATLRDLYASELGSMPRQ